MSTAKNEVQALLKKLPDDCTLEDIQYHLYVVEKIHRGIDRAEKEDEIPQQNAEKRLGKWNIENLIGVERPLLFEMATS
jgi:hypothetical protein